VSFGYFLCPTFGICTFACHLPATVTVTGTVTLTVTCCTPSSFPGFSRLRMHSKGGTPVAFVEFSEVRAATLAMGALQGSLLASSDRGAVRIEYAKSRMAEVGDGAGNRNRKRTGASDRTGNRAPDLLEALHDAHFSPTHLRIVQKVLTSSGRATRRWPMYFPIMRSLLVRPELDNTFWTSST